MRRFSKLHIWVAAVVGIPWLGGCAGLPSGPVVNGIKDPQFVRATQPAGIFGSTGTASESRSEEIDGATGRTFNCGRFTLVVPPGAFTGVATITIFVPDVNVLRCDLSISPASANGFAMPVTLITDYGSTDVIDPSSIVEVWFDEAAQLWREVPGTRIDAEARKITAPLSHFSEYGVAHQTKAGW